LGVFSFPWGCIFLNRVGEIFDPWVLLFVLVTPSS